MKYQKFDPKALEELSGALYEAESGLADLLYDVRHHFYAQTGKWQDSDEGAEYESRIAELESIKSEVESTLYDVETLLDNLKEEE